MVFAMLNLLRWHYNAGHCLAVDTVTANKCGGVLLSATRQKYRANGADPLKSKLESGRSLIEGRRLPEMPGLAPAGDSLVSCLLSASLRWRYGQTAVLTAAGVCANSPVGLKQRAALFPASAVLLGAARRGWETASAVAC
jgi:hypothetical protein